ncbi:MAG: hypothetical protein Q9186_003213 [Xanthomendoza sp. 1 TL-2023]
MTQLDPSTSWILQELEVLLASFPMRALRLSSPIIMRIRAATSDSPASDPSPRYRSSTAPHSRYSPYRPFSRNPISPQSPVQELLPSRPSQADPTAFALRTVFPQALTHHLDSLQATYLTLHYITSLPTSEFAAPPPPHTAASPLTSSTKHSRSRPIVSNVPAKARAMLGLDSQVRSPTPVPTSPATSWFRAHSPELDADVKSRLEAVEFLLETSIRRILVEIEGRAFGERDDALVRAVGEVVKMGERKNGVARL